MLEPDRKWLAAAAALAGVGVALGAFGAHGLQQMVTPERLVTWDTAVRYQMDHALGLLVASAVGLAGRGVGRWFVAGIVLFSGSLYALVLSGVGPLGAITPFGGLCFLVGWAIFARAALRS
ncbi:MAG: DUF423 domain-containing protein [Gammaproteobacteria bacterium]|nr:DUF423 domain-containing protein [Gammaproteobacteria bacterium]